jgi:succinoglycan biosynthesis transport protein ExoP
MQQSIEPPWLAMEAPANSENALDIWGFIRRRKSIVFVLAAVGAGLGYFLFQQQIPQYRSSARMEVIHSANERILDNVMGEDMLGNAQYVIPSPDVLGPAFQKHGLAQLDTFRGMTEDEAIAFITGRLGITQLSRGVIELRFEGGDPRDTPTITNAIANEYIARQMASFEGESEKLRKLLETDRTNIEAQLNAAEKEYADFVRSAALLSSGGDSNQARTRLNALSQKVATLDIHEAELVAQLELIDRKLREGGQRDALLILIGKDKVKESEPARTNEQHVSYVNQEKKMSEALLPWVVEAAVLKEKLGAAHPRLKAIEKRIELIREEFGRMQGMVDDPLPEEPEEDESDYLAIYHQSLKHELEQLRAQRDDLQEMATAAEQEAHLVQNDEQTELRLSRKIDRFQNQYDGIARQIEQTEVNAGMSGVRADLIAPAVYGTLVYPIIYKFVGLGGFIGMLAGLGLGYLVELADRSFRKPDEIVREFGVSILGHIPYMKEQRLRGIRDRDTGGMDRTVVSAHLPRSRPAEAYRSVRTAICFSALGDSHRVIQVTSPAAGDGKSTLAANLAVSLAQSGKRTILVESDFRRPNVHKITGVSNDVGIVDVLRGTAELADVIQEVSVKELSVIPCGRLPGNPSELLTRPEYESLLEMLRDKFDYVVVDSPPVLVVTDACSVAPRTDAVIVCIRLGRHTRDFGRRALDQLRDVGANVIGMVINGVDESDAYGYGSYSYSDYGRSYGNSAYGYRNNEGNEGYFAEEDETVPIKRLVSAGDKPVIDEEVIEKPH